MSQSSSLSSFRVEWHKDFPTSEGVVASRKKVRMSTTPYSAEDSDEPKLLAVLFSCRVVKDLSSSEGRRRISKKS